MGVHATFCQLCGLPTQHDHYVPSASGMLRIYRGSMEGGGHDWSAEATQPFAFRPEHAWLKDAVGITEDGVVRGTVTDGGLLPRRDGGDDEGEELYVGRGDEDAIVFHHACWQLMGAPESPEDAPRGVALHGWALIEPYQEQLFEFSEFAQDGKGALLADPAGTSPDAVASRARVEALLAQARRCPAEYEDPQAVADVLRRDRDWHGLALRPESGGRAAIVHYRQLDEALSRAEWPTLLCFIRNYAGGSFPDAARLTALEDFEVRFKAALEPDALGVMVMAAVVADKTQYLAYVKDEAEAKRRVDALGWGTSAGLSEYDNARDPTWKIFFHEMGLPRR